MPTATAYQDGFEVIVFDRRDGVATNVRSLSLKEAEAAVAAGASAILPTDPAPITQQLSAGRQGDSRVYVGVESSTPEKQRVRVTFSESKRTYVYEYAVDGSRITPIGSEYRDLTKSNTVRYVDEKRP